MSSNKNRTHPYLRTSVSAVALLVGAGVFAVPGTATAGEIADLCGDLITEHVTIVDVSDSYSATCTITIADKASLTLKGSSFTVGGGGGINIDSIGPNGSFAMRMSHLSATSGGSISVETPGMIDLRGGSSLSANSVSLETVWGDISVRDSDLSAGSGNIDLRSGSGDISVKSSTLSADTGGVDLNSSSGDVTVLDGSILNAGNGSVGISGEDVTVKGNELYASGGNVRVEADDELKFIGNLVDARNDSVGVSLRGGDTVIVKQNTFEVEASDSGAYLRVENYDDGTIEFKDNTGSISAPFDDRATLGIDGFGASDLDVRNNDIDLSGTNNEVEIKSDTGDLTVKDNMFDGADTATASTTGNCTSVNNTPTITCT